MSRATGIAHCGRQQVHEGIVSYINEQHSAPGQSSITIGNVFGPWPQVKFIYSAAIRLVVEAGVQVMHITALVGLEIGIKLKMEPILVEAFSKVPISMTFSILQQRSNFIKSHLW